MSSSIGSSSSSLIRAGRKFDILIYGATGFAGKHVVKHFLTNHPSIKIAIAGRNETKLSQLASDLNSNNGTNGNTNTTNNNNTSNKISPDQILVASADSNSELTSILCQAKIVLACAGPYRTSVGNNIVQAAIQTQTDYLDLCGEPQFFDDMLTKYDEEARGANTLVISACAFDCVPAEMSYMLSSRELKKRYNNNATNDTTNATMNDNKDEQIPVTNVEIIHTFQNIQCANATTYHAAVDGFHASYNGTLSKSRKAVLDKIPYFQTLKETNKKNGKPSNWDKGLVTVPGMTTPLYHDKVNQYILKFMGADASCILSSDRYLRYRQHQHNESSQSNNDSSTTTTTIPTMPYLSVCFAIQQKINAYKFLTYGAVFTTLAKYKLGCQILHSNPELFTHNIFTTTGPTSDQLQNGSFATYATAYGYTKDQVVCVKISGSEPGYIATSAMLCALSLTVLYHRESLKFSGGVMLPGAAFCDCDVVYDMLRQEGIQIDVMDDISIDNNDDSGDGKVPFTNEEKV